MDKYNLLKSNYYQDTDINYRKNNGQIFTPRYIADIMSRWILGAENVIYKNETAEILDPAAGLGVFFQSIINSIDTNQSNSPSTNIFKVYGIEKDQKLSRECKKLYTDFDDILIQNGDYLLDWGSGLGLNKKFDGIICNPPYLMYKKYNSERYLAIFKEKMNIELSGFINLCMLFLLKSMQELKEGGRMAYIVPSEFMNSDYGKEIKEIIKDYGYLRYVILLNYNLFEVKTTSSILLFSNDIYNNSEIRFINIDSKEEMLDVFCCDPSIFTLEDYQFNKGGSGDKNRGVKTFDKSIDYENIFGSNSVVYNKDLDVGIKWRYYYQKSNSKDYKNLVKLSEYAKVLRGIATGANDFFLFNESKKNEYKIADRYLLPCITRSSHIDKPFINQSYFQQLKDEDKKVYLLNAAEQKQDQNLKKYIEYGEKMDYNLRYLTKYRNPWYKLENKSPAPILGQVFNRTGLRFIINEANLYNLTAFHGIYIKFTEYTNILKAYLLTGTAVKIIEDNRREYGDGLNKFEPNDLNKGLILDFKIITKTDREKISKLYKKYRRIVTIRNNGSNGLNINKKEVGHNNISNCLEELNQIFLMYLRK